MPKRNNYCNFCGKKIEIFYSLEKYPAYVRVVAKNNLKKVPILPIKIGFCKNCNHVMQLNPPLKELEKVYKNFYKTYHSTAISGIGAEDIKYLTSFINETVKGKNLLEIGCSDGFLLNIMRKKGWNVWGCDPSPRTKIAAEKFGIPVKMEVFHKNLFKAEFDCVVARHLLEHINDPEKFLNEVSLSFDRKQGNIIIQVPNVLHTLKFGIIGDFHHEHINYFTPQSLGLLLNKSGYKIIRMIEHKESIIVAGEYIGSEKSLELIKGYKNKLTRLKNELLEMQKSWVANGSDVYIYGAGGHTTGLFGQIPIKAKAIIDKDSSKWGKYLPGFENIPTLPLDFIKKMSTKDILIISSEMFQDEIINDLKSRKHKNPRIVKLYPKCDYVNK